MAFIVGTTVAPAPPGASAFLTVPGQGTLLGVISVNAGGADVPPYTVVWENGLVTVVASNLAIAELGVPSDSSLLFQEVRVSGGVRPGLRGLVVRMFRDLSAPPADLVVMALSAPYSGFVTILASSVAVVK